MEAPQGEPIPAAGWWPLCKPVSRGLSFCVFFSFLWRNYRRLNSKMCVMAQMETCRGAIHRFKLNPLVSGKLLYSLTVFFRRLEFKFDRSLLSLLSDFSLPLFCIDCVCVCVFPRSNCVTSIRFSTLWSSCSYTACACFYRRDNCIRWCWEYEKIGNDHF